MTTNLLQDTAFGGGDNKPPQKYLVVLIIASIIAVGAIRSLTSCNSQKSIVARQAKAMAKFDRLKAKCDADSILQIVPPKWSAKTFPIIERTVAGKPTISIDSETNNGSVVALQVDCDSAYRAGAKSVTVNCPPSTVKIITKRVTIHDTVFQEKSDALRAEKIEHQGDVGRLQNEILSLHADIRAADTAKIKAQADAKEWHHKAKNRFWWLVGIVSGFTLYTAWRIRTAIAKDAIKNAGRLLS